MIKDRSFRKSILFSFLGHLTVLSIFVISFGNKIPSWGQTDINFWGEILQHHDLLSQDEKFAFLGRNMPASPLAVLRAGPFLQQQLASPPLSETGKNKSLTLASYSLKPFCDPDFRDHKLFFPNQAAVLPAALKKKEEVVLFHPVLPYHFALYFKDRQVANIELLYKVIKHGKTSSVVIQRRISSGNLEVDLLSMRQISHYLFIQQDKILPELWHKVKIEFSPRQEAVDNDRY